LRKLECALWRSQLALLLWRGFEMTKIPQEAVTAATAIIRAHDNEAWGEDCGDEPYADLVTRMLTAALPFLSVQGALNIDAIVQPLEDIHAPGGLCRWTAVATAIGEVRRSLSALEPTSDACQCTKIQQDETCPVGYPSLLCEICDGKGVLPSALSSEGAE